MKTTTPARLAARLGIYTLGLLILAFGIALAVNCKLGVSPVSSLPYVVSLIFNVSLGTCTTIVYATYVLLQMVLLRKFQPALLLQLVFSTIFGWFVDGAKYGWAISACPPISASWPCWRPASSSSASAWCSTST